MLGFGHTEAQLDDGWTAKLNLLDKGRAVGWLQDGVSVCEVGRRLQVSPSRLRQRFLATGSVGQVLVYQTKVNNSKARPLHHQAGSGGANIHCQDHQEAPEEWPEVQG